MKLLVPTDFSANAFSAARYAAELAQEHQYSLHIFHHFKAVSSGFEDEELTGDRDRSDLLKADLTIKEWVGELHSAYPNVAIAYHNERGLLDDALPKEA